MRLASPLLTRHVVHWAEGDPAIPSVVQRYIRRITANGEDLSEAMLHPNWFVSNAQRYTRLALEQVGEVEALVAYAQEPERAAIYRQHLLNLRLIPTRIPHRILAVEGTSGRVSMGLTDEEREQLDLLSGITPSLFADADDGILQAWSQEPTYQVLQAHPPIDSSQLRDAFDSKLVMFLDPSESHRFNSLNQVINPGTDNNESPAELARYLGHREAVLLGPVHFTSETFPAGEAFGSAVVDTRWFEPGREDMHRMLSSSYTTAIFRMRSNHSNVLPYSMQSVSTIYVPVDWSDEQRLANTLQAYLGRVREPAQNASRKASEWVKALFKDKLQELRKAALERWLTSRRSTALANIQREVRSAAEQVDYHRQQLLSSVRSMEQVQARYEQAQLMPEGLDPSELEGLDRLLERGVLTDFIPGETSDQFTFTTRELYAHDPRSQLWHRLGSFLVSIDMAGNRNAMTIHNNSNLQRDGYDRNMQHPHVFANGIACLGSFVEVQTDLLINRDWRTLIDVTLAYLESVNVGDPAGRHVNQWPIASDEMQDELNRTHGYSQEGD